MATGSKRGRKAPPRARQKPLAPRKTADASLKQQLAEARAQQAATAAVLRVIARSRSDVQPVFDAIVRSAARLFGRFASLRIAEPGGLRRRALSHPQLVKRFGLEVIPLDRDSLAGQVVLEGNAKQLMDTRGPDATLYARKHAHKWGYRSNAIAPLKSGSKVIGIISVSSPEPGALSGKQMALLETFADQAVIAIENVRLFNETREALDRQTATAEILKVIASSPTDLQPVFDAIAENAARVCGAEDVLIWRVYGSSARIVAKHGPFRSEDVGHERPLVRGRGERSSGDRSRRRSMFTISQRPKRISRVQGQEACKWGVRTALATPLMREGVSIGAIHCRRMEVRPFTDKQIDLLKTFADQAVIAIENVRLFNETKEALDRQTATAEILKVISSSPTDTQPVFDAIVDACQRLFPGYEIGINLQDEAGGLYLSAVRSPNADALRRFFEQSPTRKAGTGVKLRRTVAHYPDIDAAGVPAEVREGCRVSGVKAIVYAPLVLESRGIGSLWVARTEAHAFADKEIDLLKTFAEQAVIAIQNARLFNETREALERQTATAGILAAMSGSMTDARPVFDAIVRSCSSLFVGSGVTLRLLREGVLQVEANVGMDAGPVPVDRSSGVGACVLDARTIHLPDLEAAVAVFPRIPQLGLKYGFHSGIYAPLLRDGVAIGTIAVLRPEIGGFSDKDVALFNTFADQAVIAIENVRLFNETKEALERQTATAEILSVIASSPSDVQPVFDTVATKSVDLCGGSFGVVTRFDGEQIHIASIKGTASAEAVAKIRAAFPAPPSRRGAASRCILTREVVHMPDVTQDPEYRPGGVAQAGGIQSILAVPLLREGRAIGSVSVARTQRATFTVHQIALLKTFADQAVIAIENVRLFNETKESLERQTATAEILKVIASSPSDVQPVFDAIAEAAVRLIGGFSASVTRIAGDKVQLVALTSTSKSGDEAVRATFPRPISEGPIGKAIASRAPAFRTDTETDPDTAPQIREMARARGYRSLLAVPMLRNGEPIGAIAVTRRAAGAFSSHQTELLQTFADQAVIAIENVRLFNETKESLERQTATAEILKVIASSPSDVQPVFDAIVQSGLKLFPDSAVVVTVSDGDQVRLAAIADADPLHAEQWRKRHQFPLTREYMHAVAILDRRVIDMPDAQAYEGGPLEAGVRNFLATGNRAVTIVPMQRPDAVIGTISVVRRAPGPLTEKQIALLRTFADQAVIAIENVRLFNETKESLERQTATAEILKVIASSPSEVQPVLDAVAERAARICGAPFSDIILVDRGGIRVAAGFGDIARSPRDQFLPLDRSTAMGRSIVDHRAIHVADLLEHGDEYPRGREMALQFGHRTLIAVPLLREGKALGTILVRRTEVRPFDDKEIALLKTFADQAVIAIENVRLFNETKEALEQQTATAEILKVISESPTDTQPVFDAIVQAGLRLFPDASVLLGIPAGGRCAPRRSRMRTRP